MESQFTILNGGRTGEQIPEQAGAAPPVYDFRRPESMPKAQIRHLCTLFESFVRSLSAKASAYLRYNLTSRTVAVRQQAYGEFLHGLTNPTCAYSLALKPYPSNAVLEISPGLAFPVLEILLGGKAGGPTEAGREPTEIERHVLEEIVQMILVELRESWKQFAQVEFSLEAADTNPHAMAGLPPTEPVVAFSAEVQFGEERGTINLAVPILAIRMMQQNYEQQNSTEAPVGDASSQDAAMRALKGALVVVEARMERASILIRDLLDLKPGQVIAFAQPVNRPIECAVNGQQIYKGDIVAMGTRAAFQIVGEEPSRD